jgi:Bacterial-like globin
MLSMRIDSFCGQDGEAGDAQMLYSIAGRVVSPGVTKLLQGERSTSSSPWPAASPKLYAEIHGHSNVREMHMHIEIERNAHDDWLNCMSIAIDRVGLNKDVGEKLMTHFRAVAAGLQNAP